MKRDLSIVTDEVRECLRSWVEILHDRYGECPFEEVEEIPSCPTICYAVFPKLQLIDPDSIVCPCDVFKNSYVLKVTKEIIKCP